MDEKRVPWNKALNALDFGRYRWRYFSLEKEPTKEEVVLDEQGMLRGKSYKQVQRSIQEISKVLECYKKENRQELIKSVQNYLIALQQSAYVTEEEIYEQLIAGPLGVATSYREIYENTIDNNNKTKTKGRLKPSSSIEINKMTTPELWTRAANNLLSSDQGDLLGTQQYNFKSKEEAEEQALAIILSSRDLYEKLRKTHDDGIFSRRLALMEPVNDSYLSSRAISKLWDDAIGKEFSGNEIFQMMAIDEDNPFSSSGIFSGAASDLSKLLRSSFESAFNVYADVKGFKASGKGELGDWIREKKRKVQATSVSSTIRKRVGQAIDQFIDSQTGWSEDQKYYFGSHFVFQCVNEAGKPYFKAYSIKYMQQNKLSSATKNVVDRVMSEAQQAGDERKFNEIMNQDKNLQKELVITLLDVLKTSIGEFFDDKKTTENLNLLSLDHFNVPSFISRCFVNNKQYFESVESFYMRAQNILEGNIKKYFTTAKYLKDLYKSFKASNSNAYVAGFLGEMSALLSTNSLFNRLGRQTGSYDSLMQGHNYGQSVNDIKTSYRNKENKAQSIGINVKHYAMHEGNEFELYPASNQKGLSIFTNTMQKYLGAEDVNIVRFVFENNQYFQDDINLMEGIAERIIYYHIPEFYRVYDHSKGAAVNVFYVIQNVFYPLSYIYGCALKQLDKILRDQTLDNLLTVKVEKAGGREAKYKTLTEAREKWEEKDWRLSSKRKGLYDMTVKTNGLKVNLMRFNIL